MAQRTTIKVKVMGSMLPKMLCLFTYAAQHTNRKWGTECLNIKFPDAHFAICEIKKK